MAFFNPSTVTWAAAIQRVVDTAGASGDSEMSTRALSSLRAAFQNINTKKYQFTRAEAAPIQVVAPFSVTGVTASAGQASAAAPVGHGFKPDDLVLGDGFMVGARISATAVSGFGIYGTVTATAAGLTVITATAIRDYYDLPSDWRVGYSAKLIGSNRSLAYIQRRGYDRVVSNEFTPGTPAGYDQFLMGTKGKIRLLPPPSAADVLQLRYYRRLYLASATGDATALDIPEDYEETPIAWAKWHFLVDKQEGKSEQAGVWMALAREGLKTILADETAIPDENLGFVPSHTQGAFGGDNSTRYIDWDQT
jgi:hypothetical protein